MDEIRQLRAERDALVLQIGEVNDSLGIIDHCQIKPLFDALHAEIEQRTAAVIVSEGGQALACSASVAAAYGTLRGELADCRLQLDSTCNAEELRQVRAERDAATYEALGFAHAWCCHLLDVARDPRNVECAQLLNDWNAARKGERS
jgi:hypothetical protein